MLSRLFWFLVAGLALIGGILLQDGNEIFSWGEDADQARTIEQRVEAGVDRAVDRSIEKIQVTDSNGEPIDVPAETKQALAEAVGRLVKSEAELAVLQVKDGSAEEMEAATIRRDQARAEVETLKAKIEGEKALANEGRQAARDQVRTEVRETIRDAVRN